MKCDVCLKIKQTKDLRAVQIWHTISLGTKPQTISYYKGRRVFEKKAIIIDDCEKQIIACVDCLDNLNFRRVGE